MAATFISDQSIVQIHPIVDDIFIKFENSTFNRCYDSSSTGSYLILADLVAADYKNVPRQIGLNSGQLKACLKFSSKWHAASVKLIHATKWTLEEQYALFLQPHVSLNGSKQYRILFENAVSGCIDAFQNDPDLRSICDKLIRLKPNIFQKCCAAAQRDESEFNVLTHGDMWSNNIMFDAAGDADRVLFVRCNQFQTTPLKQILISLF